MTLRLDAGAADFTARFADLVEVRREETDDVRDAVASIIRQVRAGGDAALVELTARFDRFEVEAGGLRIGSEELDAALAGIEPAEREALTLAAERIRAFHARQVPENRQWVDEAGVVQGLSWSPLDAVGLYVPGGTAAYPSSVLMNAIPAKVAGCRRLVMVAPTPDGLTNRLVLAAARLSGVDEVYRIGGAQAVAALAYGTATIDAVDKIVGPGNAYVAEAKRQVFGRVGIDMVAGPSEVVIVADGSCPPAWIAADLLAQAEHDTRAQSILLTDDAAFADAVAEAVEAQLATLDRRTIASESWQRLGAIITLASLADAPALVNELAPEHLQLAVADPAALQKDIRHAGAIFAGAWTPEVIGDYVGGPNHVLPTSRTARFASGLATLDFMKRTTLLGCDAAAFAKLAPAAERLARAEGLDAHAAAVALRRAGTGAT